MISCAPLFKSISSWASRNLTVKKMLQIFSLKLNLLNCFSKNVKQIPSCKNMYPDLSTQQSIPWIWTQSNRIEFISSNILSTFMMIVGAYKEIQYINYKFSMFISCIYENYIYTILLIDALLFVCFSQLVSVL